MNKINVIVKDKNTLVLTEDAKKGDYIDLNTVSIVDLSTIEELLERNKDAVYNKKLNEYKDLLKKEHERQLNEVNDKHQLEISLIKKDQIQQFNEIKNQHLLEMSILRKDLESLNSNINLRVENEKIKLNNELDLYKQKKELEIKEIELKYNKLLDELKLQHLKEIEEKNDKIHEKE